jgi:hypothetical protein
MDLAPPRSDRASTVGRRAARRDPRGGTRVAGEDRRDPFPSSFSDKDALLIGTGRRTPTDAEKAALGVVAAKLPLILG